MKKAFYEEPRIDLCEVSVESGIAISPVILDFNGGLSAGEEFDEIIYEDEL